jgi:hypothetical protein
MLRIDIRDNIIAHLDHLRKNAVPFATAVALTRTAQAVKAAEVEEMKSVFDRPTPFTLRSLYVKGATKSNLEARVWIKDINRPQHYLIPQIHGGARHLKRFEEHLQRAGLLPSGMAAVPGAGARLNKYGNMSAGQITQILSVIGAHPDIYARVSAASRKRNRKPRAYFVGRPGGGRLPLGIWEKRGHRVLPILIFVRRPTYQKRFDFYGVATKTIRSEFVRQFQRALIEFPSR